MNPPEPESVEKDSRGILDPWLLQQRVRLTRYPVGPALVGLIDRFWAVRWDLPQNTVHRQHVLTHPACNLSIGHANGRASGHLEARLSGVARTLTTRVLVGRGWTVAAMTTPGGLGAFVAQAVSDFTDRVVPLGEVLPVDEAKLIDEISGHADEESRVGVLAMALERALGRADPQRVHRARQVAEVARLAEFDQSVCQLRDMCARSGIAPRKLQRLFVEYAGVSPTWVVRRYRLLNAAEAVRDGRAVRWADVAANLGFADQAHLIREFHAAIGKTPAAYAELQAPRRDEPSP